MGGLTLDFADDISTVIDGGAVAAAAVNESSASQQGALIVFNGSSQVGFIYDHDGDGQLSDGDTLVDLTGTGGGIAFNSSTGFTLTLAGTEGADAFNFSLDQGDLSL